MILQFYSAEFQSDSAFIFHFASSAISETGEPSKTREHSEGRGSSVNSDIIADCWEALKLTFFMDFIL